MEVIGIQGPLPAFMNPNIDPNFDPNNPQHAHMHYHQGMAYWPGQFGNLHVAQGTIYNPDQNFNAFDPRKQPNPIPITYVEMPQMYQPDNSEVKNEDHHK